MTLLARLFDEQANAFRTIAQGDVSRAFARHAMILCPHEGCGAEMRPIGPAPMVEGDPAKSRRGHFNTKDHHQHAATCPESGRTPQLRKIKSVCDAIDQGIPVLVNLDFDTGLNPRKPVADFNIPGHYDRPAPCLTFRQWERDAREQQYERPQPYVAVAMHDAAEVAQLIKKVSQYDNGVGLPLLHFRAGDTVQQYRQFTVYDRRDALKSLVLLLGRAYQPGMTTVQAAPKMLFFWPSKTKGRAVDGFKSVKGERIITNLPVSHYFDIHVHLADDEAQRLLTGHEGPSAVVARPYLLGEEARSLKIALQSGRGMTNGFPLHLFFHVVGAEQLMPTTPPTRQLALPLKPEKAAKRLTAQ